MGHNHAHKKSSQNLKVAFFLNLAFTVFELLGGIYTNSVAIISDAIHDFGDSLALGTAWYLEKLSHRESDRHFSFGYARFSLLGALINSVVLIAGFVFVINEAVGRLLKPEASNATGMLLFAIVGVAVNGYAAWRMSGGKTLNEKVMAWHLLEDVLGWVAVLIVAIVLHFKTIHYLDPALSLLITAYILWGVVRRLKETLFLFLQGTPQDVDLVKIQAELLQIDNVQSLHNTHLWSLEGEHHVFTTHVKLGHINSFRQLLEAKRQIKAVLARNKLRQCTIETELDNETCALAQE